MKWDLLGLAITITGSGIRVTPSSLTVKRHQGCSGAFNALDGLATPMTFAQVAAGLHRYFSGLPVDPLPTKPPIKVSIEVPSADIASRVLWALNKEFEPLLRFPDERSKALEIIAPDKPLTIMGIEFTLKYPHA